jgi:hypothetical protein
VKRRTIRAADECASINETRLGEVNRPCLFLHLSTVRYFPICPGHKSLGAEMHIKVPI